MRLQRVELLPVLFALVLCAATVRAQAGPCPPDSGRSFVAQGVENQDSLRRVIAALDQRIAAASQSQLPELLLARGRAQTWYMPPAPRPLGGANPVPPPGYEYNEIGGDFRYTGRDFQELIQRFPNNPLADAAAYALTFVERGGECEGDLDCVVNWSWGNVSTFLRAHPQSPFADSAVDRAIAAFHVIRPDFDLRSHHNLSGSNDFDWTPDQIPPLIESLDSVGTTQIGPRKPRLLIRAGELWTQIAKIDRARSAYTAALSGANVAQRACIQARLRALPKHVITLAPAQVIRPNRVELRWDPIGGGRDRIAVRRSEDRNTGGTVVTRLPASAVAWTDTTTLPGRLYWYRLEAEGAGAPWASNLASVRTPTYAIRASKVAVSLSDAHLYVFGELTNGLPQVIRVSPAGDSVQQSDGELVNEWGNLDANVRDMWVADETGRGVLHLPLTPERTLPAEYFSMVQPGSLPLSPNRKQPWSGFPALVSLDEPRRMLWMDGSNQYTVSIDCWGDGPICWRGLEKSIELRGKDGVLLNATPLPKDPLAEDRSYPTAIYANPRDSSALVVLGRGGRILLVDRNGSTRASLGVAFSCDFGRQSCTADADRRAMWYVSRENLVRVDVAKTDLTPTVVVTKVEFGTRLAPDLQGGLWLVSDSVATRIDRNGKKLTTVLFSNRRDRRP